MMHLQSTFPDWLECLLEQPDNTALKAVDHPGILREGMLAWIAAGRDPRKLFTVYRHENIQSAESMDWEATKQHWRNMFFRFIDRTYLEQYAPYIKGVTEANEYTATSTWSSPTDKAKVLRSMWAAAIVWNEEFRGKIVHSPDGGVGLIPADCKLLILCGPVSNDIPVEVFQLAIEQDCIIDYHAYTRWSKGLRFPNDWNDDSGRWDVLERKYGLYPEWFLGEAGPYIGVNEGWIHEACLGGDKVLLLVAVLLWVLDIQKTRAYQEGRLRGFALFTSGNIGWVWYQLQAEHHQAIATLVLRKEWKPGMSLAQIRYHAQEILNLSTTPNLRDKTNQDVINLFATAFGRLPLNKPPFIEVLTRATDINALIGNRPAMYAGPAVQYMNITQAEKDKLVGVIG